jgi:hypothetical protein
VCLVVKCGVLTSQQSCHDELENSSSTDLQASQSGVGDDIFSAVLNTTAALSLCGVCLRAFGALLL